MLSAFFWFLMSNWQKVSRVRCCPLWKNLHELPNRAIANVLILMTGCLVFGLPLPGQPCQGRG
jgi:hypothetical protein